MTIPTVQDAAYPAPDEVRDAILRSVAFAFARRGLVANVLPGSDHYIRAQAYGARVVVAIANNRLALDASDPLKATGQGLLNLAAVFGIYPRSAAKSAGAVSIACVNAVSIPPDFFATAPNGKKYRTYLPAIGLITGASVNLLSVDGGDDTNQDPGVKLTWDSASIGALSPQATVLSPGLTGGRAADNDEAVRSRLLDRLAFPPGGGNSAQIAAWAEETSASVEHAYVYPAIRGPASYDVALTAAGGNRVLASSIVADIRGYVMGKQPGHADGNFTSVTPQYIDVTLVASLAYPAIAGGVGGGWRDSNPWPAGADVYVSTFNSLASIATVTGTVAPTVGQSIGIWDFAGQQMREYVITSVTGSSGAYQITVQGGFVVNPLDGFVSAGAFNLAGYAAAFAAQVALLGPGEKTATPELLPRSLRFPSQGDRAASDLTSLLTAAVTNAYPELKNLNYASSYDTGTLVSRYAPSLPLTTADPPNILVLKQFAIRAP